MTRHEYVKTVLEPRFKDEDELYHHGIIGMKWGVRRYQNEDGTLTEEGKKRQKYNDKEIKQVSDKIYSAISRDKNIRDMEEGKQLIDNHVIRHAIWETGEYIDHMTGKYGKDFTQKQEMEDYDKIEHEIHKNIANGVANNICANNSYLKEKFANSKQFSNPDYTKELHPVVAGMVYTELKDRNQKGWPLYLTDDELKEIAYNKSAEYLK